MYRLDLIHFRSSPEYDLRQEFDVLQDEKSPKRPSGTNILSDE